MVEHQRPPPPAAAAAALRLVRRSPLPHLPLPDLLPRLPFVLRHLLRCCLPPSLLSPLPVLQLPIPAVPQQLPSVT